MRDKYVILKSVCFAIVFLLTLAGCNQPRPLGGTPTNDITESVATEILAEATDAEIAKTLTATVVPLALTVNNLNYPLEYFKQDLLRFMIAFPDMEPQTAFDTLSNDLVEQLILEKAAYEDGFTISEEEVNQRIADLSAEIGGEDALNNWLSNHYYTESSFQIQLVREIAVAYEKEIIFDQVSSEMDQVELYQILVYDEATAKTIYQALLEGTDFFWLAEQYHPATLGYLGWNPQGAMLPSLVEETAFSMEVGNYSDIIQTDYGYHIIYLNNREIHPVSPENLLLLQETALNNWMETQKQSATIEIFASYDD